MAVYLLDVNVLIALAWPNHSAHQDVQSWFARNSTREWSTCPFTECAFIRIVSNPAFSSDFLTLQESIHLLDLNLQDPRHHFWADDLPVENALRQFQGRISGHQQVTDAYLLGLTLHKKGRLATLDRSVVALLPPGSRERDRIEIIPKVS